MLNSLKKSVVLFIIVVVILLGIAISFSLYLGGKFGGPEGQSASVSTSPVSAISNQTSVTNMSLLEAVNQMISANLIDANHADQARQAAIKIMEGKQAEIE